MTSRSGTWALFFAAASLVGACATPRPYEPNLASLAIPVGGDGDVDALVSITGPYAAQRGMAERIEVGLRLDNRSGEPVTLAPGDLELVCADLQSLGRPELIPAGPVTLPPGADATLRAAFALPAETKPDAAALRALNVRLTLEAGGRSYASSVTFDRTPRERMHGYAAYEYGYWGYPGGPIFVVPHHHHHMHG